MTENQFDLAIVDPCYGIGMDGGNVGYKGDNNLAKKSWDSKPTPKSYFDLLLKKSSNQVVWGGNYFTLPPSRCFIVWDKGAGFKGRTYAEAELAWTSFDANVKIFSYDPLARRDYSGKIHPTQKPVNLYTWLLKNYAKEGDHILDTHGGSMSSVIACLNVGFKITCYEIDEDYFDAGCRRVEEAQKQLRLF